MFRPAAELAELVRSRELTARELVEISLRRIDDRELLAAVRRLPRRYRSVIALLTRDIVVPHGRAPSVPALNHSNNPFCCG